MNYSSLMSKLYAELYEPKLLPQDLLENLNLKNYISVNFSVRDELTIGNTKCYLDDGSIGEFVYTFNKNKLVRLEALHKNEHTIIYDRQAEIDKLKSEIKHHLNYSIVS